MYKEGNNRQPSVNQKPLVNKNDKAWNKCHNQDKKNTPKNLGKIHVDLIALKHQ